MSLQRDKYPCRQCRGEKVIPRKLNVLQVCPDCNGHGCVDWVSYAMGKAEPKKPIDHQIQYNVCMKNIHNLIHEIKIQGQKMGLNIDIDIRKTGEELYNKMTTVNPLIYNPNPYRRL